MSKRITLKPVPGFVVKTTNQLPGIYTPTSLPSPSPSTSTPASASLLEPTRTLQSTPVVHGFKIFVNIAFDAGVPPPPRSSENDIRKAMAGDEGVYFVPVVVSDGREATDKAGKISLVFDAVFHESIRERTSKDQDYKTFIIELALERVEEKSGLTLGREIGTPNIKSKGPLEERSVLVPASWSPTTAGPSKPLIEELAPSVQEKSAVPTKSALKKTTPTPAATKPPSAASTVPPKWSLEIENSGTAPNPRTARIEIQLPLMTREDYESTNLDLERNRLIFECKPKYGILDVPLLAGSGTGGKKTLGMDIDNVTAEWSIKQSLLVVRAPILTQ